MSTPKTKYVILNGPIGCGKTALVQKLKEEMDICELKCKDHLHKLTMEYFNCAADKYWHIYENRQLKTLPYKTFGVSVLGAAKLAGYLDDPAIMEEHRTFERNGKLFYALNIREAMIFTSEILVKPFQGEDYFGRIRAQLTPLYSVDLYIDDSGGFDTELPPLIEKIGRENVLCIRVRGRGTWKGDSRSYLSDEIVNCVDIFNQSTEEQFQEETKRIIYEWIEAANTNRSPSTTQPEG